MTDIATAFPKRPIKISKTGTWPGVFSYAGGLLLLAVAGFIAVWQAPGILNDWMISTNPVIVPDAIISEGECNVRRAVFVDCEAHVSYEVKNKPFERDIELLFVDFGGGDYEVDVVRSGNNPGMVALTLGLDMLWNRIIVGSLFVVLLAAGGVALFAGGLRSDRQRRLARRGTILTPVAVQIRSIEKVVGAKAIQFEYGVNKKQRPLLAISRFRKADEPYWLDPEAGTALAVMPEGGTVPVLVDGQLSQLDLSASERYVLLNGRSASPA